MLRLEHLFDRLDELASRSAAVDHHFALATLFEVMDVAARADLKGDLLKELDRHRGQMLAYRGLAGVDEQALALVLERIDRAHAALASLQGKPGQGLAGNEWLMSIRSRISIPAGTCGFDLPAYWAWQQHGADARRADILGWTSGLAPLAAAVRLLLGLLRDGGRPQRMIALGGQYQQSLQASGGSGSGTGPTASHKAVQLMRVRLAAADPLVPEISGHRLLVSIRFMKPDGDGRLRPAGADCSFELSLCT